MAQEWYFTKDGERKGPITSQQLKQLAASGELQPTDLVWTEGKDEWKPASIVQGLFPATGQPKATKPPPITEHSKPTAPAPTSIGPTDQPDLLKRVLTKFNSLKTPQKILVGAVAGMGTLFFLCIGMCGLGGLLMDGDFDDGVWEVAQDDEAESQDADAEAPEEQGGEEQAAELPPASGRQLEVRTGTVTDKSGWMPKFNSSLENVKCHATSDQVIIDFDVDKSKWIFQYRLQLLVRLFDRNGNHLTNFTTVEKFTMFPEVFKFRSSPTETLKAKGNRLVYNVNIRDLRDAAMVEIGFSHDSP